MVEVKQEVKNNVPVPPEIPKESDPKLSVAVKGLVNEGVSFVVNGPKKNDNPAGEKVSGTKPPAFEGQQTEKLFDIRNLTTNLTPKKVAGLVGVLVMVVVIGAALYVKFIRKAPVRTINVLVAPPTPSYSPYQKYKPSIYAEDPNFKKIDEGISVLQNEVNNSTLDDKTLLPPNLDFSVNFK